MALLSIIFLLIASANLIFFIRNASFGYLNEVIGPHRSKKKDRKVNPPMPQIIGLDLTFFVTGLAYSLYSLKGFKQS